MGVEGRLFEIVRVRATAATSEGLPSTLSSTPTYQLSINFDPQIITLFKEVRNLLWLGFQVPHALSNMAKDAKRVYPHAVSLMESVRTYGQVIELIKANSGIEWLVAEWRNEGQRMVARGMNIRWDYFVNQYDAGRYGVPGGDGRGGDNNRHVQFVREFAAVVSVLQVSFGL